MIPILLVLGFVAGVLAGRIAWLYVPLAALAWAAGLSDAGVCQGDCEQSAAMVAAANAAVGVGVAVALRWLALSAVRPS